MCMIQEQPIGFFARVTYRKWLLQDWKWTYFVVDVAIIEEISDSEYLKGYIMDLDEIKSFLKKKL